MSGETLGEGLRCLADVNKLTNKTLALLIYYVNPVKLVFHTAHFLLSNPRLKSKTVFPNPA